MIDPSVDGVRQRTILYSGAWVTGIDTPVKHERRRSARCNKATGVNHHKSCKDKDCECLCHSAPPLDPDL